MYGPVLMLQGFQRRRGGASPLRIAIGFCKLFDKRPYYVQVALVA